MLLHPLEVLLLGGLSSHSKLREPGHDVLIQLKLLGESLHILVRLNFANELAALHLTDLHSEEACGAASSLKDLIELVEILLLRVLPLLHGLVESLDPPILDVEVVAELLDVGVDGVRLRLRSRSRRVGGRLLPLLRLHHLSHHRIHGAHLSHHLCHHGVHHHAGHHAARHAAHHSRHHHSWHARPAAIWRAAVASSFFLGRHHLRKDGVQHHAWRRLTSLLSNRGYHLRHHGVRHHHAHHAVAGSSAVAAARSRARP
mmetsp:Transcript_61892/g.134106  ORF Transcript_61892/g.134106 Transcript_61892/m.134106 type:complete len:258 (+) Transcript_61892:539-1312(+)